MLLSVDELGGLEATLEVLADTESASELRGDVEIRNRTLALAGVILIAAVIVVLVLTTGQGCSAGMA